MNIAHIVYQFPKLSETFILNQITGLIDLGYNVDLFAFKGSDEGKVHPDVIKYDLLSKVKYFEIPNTKYKRLQKIFSYFLQKPIKGFYSLSKLKFNNLDFSTYEIINAILILASLPRGYQIFHCHYGTLGKTFLFTKLLFPNSKLVVHFHGFDITKVIQKYTPDYYKSLFKVADLILPISNHWRKKLIKLGCPESKIVVHRMGINIEQFSFKLRPLRSPIKFLTVGRLVEKKGISYAIEAFAKIVHQYPDFSFEYFIAGDGPLKSSLEEKIKKLGLENKVYLLGWVSNDEVQKLMDQAHIFLLPSITASSGDQEGIPVVLMEAMASGLPVISTYHSGIPELVIDKETGFLVPEKDISALAEKILDLVKNPDSLTQIVKNARRYVEKEYNIKRQVKKLADIYENLVRS